MLLNGLLGRLLNGVLKDSFGAGVELPGVGLGVGMESALLTCLWIVMFDCRIELS